VGSQFAHPRTNRSVGEWALEPIARETAAKRECVIAHDLGQVSADLMTIGGLGTFVMFSPPLA